MPTSSSPPHAVQIIARKPWRHIVQIVICTSELYGTL
ncbi:hypothetical protein EON62_04945 [archaeon]|nr:MAG: hypothetical protein EON62_04945 [archaeon]